MTMIIGMNHNLVPGLSIKEVERFGGPEGVGVFTRR